MNKNWNRNKSRSSFRGGRGRGHGRGSRGFWSKDHTGSHPRFNRGDLQTYEGQSNQWPRPKREAPTKRLSEQDTGVTEYINSHEGFNGIIKSRFSDFQVSEINEKGEIAKLTTLSIPEVEHEESIVEDEDLLLSKYNLEILPMETWDRVNKVAISTDPSVEKVEIDVTGMSKEERTKIHDSVKKAFGEGIVGSTVTVDDKKFVTFDKYRKGVRVDNRVKWLWPGEYVHFILYKENCDTMEAASRVAERLRCNIKSSMIGYSGTKDRRAKTSQWFSLRKYDPKKISACNDLRDIRVGNYSFTDHPLKLGMLKGNVFRICLRNVTASDESINEACSLLQKNGFINYYGLQRFGTRIEVPTYEIGKKLLQGNFREAIDSILSDDSAGGARARSRDHAPEARLMSALAQRPNDLLSALDKIPRNSRLLYLHSYQSLIWNKVASERFKRFAREPVVGDLVALDDDVEEEEIRQESDEEDQHDEQNGEEQTEATDCKKKKKEPEKKKLIAVKVLTEEDVKSNSFTIFDLVLPLPGHSVVYPPNMKDFYEELVTKDGLKLDMRHKYRNYTMSGGYRRLVIAPTLKWHCERYSNPYSDLILSDLDELNGVTKTGIVEDGKYKALLLTMTLPTSCYATMALRELLKVDTSSDNQALQNNYHKMDKSDENNDKSDENNDKSVENNDNSDVVEQSAGENVGEKRKIDSDDENVDSKKSKIEDC